MEENLQTIIASYFKWWGPEMATLLTKFGDIELQRKVVNAFMRIIQEELWTVQDDEMTIGTDLEEEIKEPIELLMSLYYLDKLAENTIEKVLSINN